MSGARRFAGSSPSSESEVARSDEKDEKNTRDKSKQNV